MRFSRFIMVTALFATPSHPGWAVEKTDSLAQRALSTNETIRSNAFKEIRELIDSRSQMHLLNEMIALAPSNEHGAKVVVEAAKQIPGLRTHATPVYKRTAEALRNHDTNSPWFVLTYLIAAMGSDELPIALKKLDSKDEKDRQDAAHILVFIANEKENHIAFESVVSRLVRALDDDDQVCQHIAETLGALGPRAKSAVPSLMEIGRKCVRPNPAICPNRAVAAVLRITPMGSKDNREAREIDQKYGD